MPRYVRRSLLLAKAEATYAQDPGGWAATDAVLVRGQPRHRILRDVVNRDLLRPTFGGSEQMVASRASEIEFDVEFASAGAAGTAPAWGRLLRACGMAQTITAGNRVEYTPAAGQGIGLAIRYLIDGTRYTSRGARGNVKFMLDSYGIPYMNFRFLGFDTNAAEDAIIDPDYAAFKRPLVLSDANAGDIRLGGTYSAGVVSGGTVLESRTLQFDLGNTVSHLKVLGGERVSITGRETTGSMGVFLSAADEVAWRTDINNNVLTSLGFNFGSSAGNRVTLFAPAVQRVDPQPDVYEGEHMMKTELRLLPSALTANDEFMIVAR